MSKYELMYIIGSQISDDQIPRLTEEAKNLITSGGGTIEKHEELGKKKLAYQIGKTRNGYYVVVNFSADSDKAPEIESRIRTTTGIIRHLMLNMDEAMIRAEKDRSVQAKIKHSRPKEEQSRAAPAKAPEKKIEIDLDAEIEKALDSKDLK